MDLYKFLKDNGFKIPDRSDIVTVTRFGYNADCALPVSSPDDNITIGTIYKTSFEPVEHGRISITYYLNAGQVKEVLKLKDFLDKNNIKYEEEGDKKVIAREFRKSADELNSVADRLEGKVS